MIMKKFGCAIVFTTLAASAPMNGAFAQTAVPTQASVVPARQFSNTSILSVSLPPNARLRLDMDARDEDILGVTKSFLRGLNGSTLKSVLAQAQSGGSNAADKQAATPDVEKLAALQFLSDADLNTIFENINHLRFVVFETPISRGAGGRPTTKQALSTIAHYENAYLSREGGRRLIRADIDDVQMLTVGFPQGGFGVVMQAPGMGMVFRASGYPNLEGVSPLVMALMLRVFAQMR